MNEKSPLSRRVSVRMAVAGAAVVLAVTTAGPALASEEDVETIRQWVRQISGMPGWIAGYNRIESFGRDTTVSGLRFRSVPSGVALTFDDITFTGRIRLDEGAISATEMESSRFEMSVATVDAVINDVKITDGTLPALGNFTLMSDDIVGNIAETYRLLAAFGMREGSFGEISMDQSDLGVTSATTYDGATFVDWADGRIARFDIGAMRNETPSPDGDIRISVAGVSGYDYDIGAVVDLFEPAEGEAPWKTAVGKVVYDDMAIEFPDGAITIASVVSEGLEVRAGEYGIHEIAEQLMAVAEAEEDPDPETLLGVFGLFDMFRVGRIELEGMELAATGIDEFRLGRMTVRNASSAYIDEFSIEDVRVSVPDEGFFDLDRFVYGRVVPPNGEAFIAAMMAAENDEDFDVADVLPQIGLFEIAGLETESTETPRVSLDRLRIELDDYFGPLPTVIAVNMDGLRGEVPEEMEMPGSPSLSDFGYDEIDADMTLRARWDPDAGIVTIDRFDFSMRDMGTLSLAATLGGLDGSILDDLEALPERLDALTFGGGSLTFRDDSIVGRVLALQAEEMGVEADVFRDQMVGALPFMLSFIGAPEFQQQIVPVLQEFLTEPGEIKVDSLPPEPVALNGLELLFLAAPQSVPDLLGITVTAGDVSSAGEIRDSIAPDETPPTPAVPEPAPSEPDATPSEPEAGPEVAPEPEPAPDPEVEPSEPEAAPEPAPEPEAPAATDDSAPAERSEIDESSKQ